VIKETYDYQPQPGDKVLYRSKQWIIVANRQAGGGFVLHNDQRWYAADQLVEHHPNWHNKKVEYSVFSHTAGKGFDFDEWEIVYRLACSYFEIDTKGWLNKEIDFAREKRKYSDAHHALMQEMFPKPPDGPKAVLFGQLTNSQARRRDSGAGPPRRRRPQGWALIDTDAEVT